MKKEAYLGIATPNRIEVERMDGSNGSIDGGELNTVYEDHLVMLGVDMGDLSDCSKGECSEPGNVGNVSKIVGRELPSRLIRKGIDHDAELDLTLEVVEISDILSLGFGEVVSSDIVDSKLVLLKDVLALGSVNKIIEAEKHAVIIKGNSVEKTSILEKVNPLNCTRGGKPLTSFI